MSDPARQPSPDGDPSGEIPLFDHDERNCSTCTEGGPDRLLGDSRIFALVVGSVFLVALFILSLFFTLFDWRWPL